MAGKSTMLSEIRFEQRPHLGLIVVNSPLTSYKNGKVGGAADPTTQARLSEKEMRFLISMRPKASSWCRTALCCPPALRNSLRPIMATGMEVLRRELPYDDLSASSAA